MAEDCSCCDLVKKHEAELYRGDEKNPGITSRLLLAEDRIKNTSQIVEQINKRFWAIMICIAGTLGVTILDILLKR